MTSSQFATPAASPGFLLWHTTLRWQRAVTGALRPLGLTHVQFVLLAVLLHADEASAEQPTQRALATRAGTDPMMTSQVVRTLEGRGLLRRHDDPHDARKRRLEITPEGARLARQALQAVEDVDVAFFADAPDGDALVQGLAALARLEEGR